MVLQCPTTKTEEACQQLFAIQFLTKVFNKTLFVFWRFEKMATSFVLLTVYFFGIYHQISCGSNDKTIIESILKGYNKYVRPIKHDNYTISVTLEPGLYQIMDTVSNFQKYHRFITKRSFKFLGRGERNNSLFTMVPNGKLIIKIRFNTIISL